MRSALTAAAMGAGPPLLFQLLLARGRMDFEACFNQIDISMFQALAASFDRATLVLFAMSALPFALLALVWYFRQNRTRVFWVWAILAGLCLWLFFTPDLQHSCGLSGFEGDLLLFLPFLAALPALWIAIWKNPSRKATP